MAQRIPRWRFTRSRSLTHELLLPDQVPTFGLVNDAQLHDALVILIHAAYDAGLDFDADLESALITVDRGTTDR